MKNEKMRTEMARSGVPIRYENGSTSTKDQTNENSSGSEDDEKKFMEKPERRASFIPEARELLKSMFLFAGTDSETEFQIHNSY